MFMSPKVRLDEREEIVYQVLNILPRFNLESDEKESIEWDDKKYTYHLTKHILKGRPGGTGPETDPYHRCVELLYQRNNCGKVSKKSELDGCSLFIYRADFPDAHKSQYKYGVERDGWFFQFQKTTARRTL